MLKTLLQICQLSLLVFAAQNSVITNAAQSTHGNIYKSRAERDALTEEQAQFRASRLSNIDYHISIDLTQSQSYFTGRTTVDFTLSDADNQKDLTLDFSGGEITQISINDIEVEAMHNGAFITLLGDHLKAGKNHVQISYQHDFSKDGTGLHSFTDPVDGKRYLYTYLWPYYANRLFPNFDQPNLKSRYNLMVLAPKDWTVVSTMRESYVRDLGDKNRWSFPPTPKMASYVFSLHAGPYKIWEDNSGTVPLRLMVRQSLAQYVNPMDWFDVTQQGLDFYKDYYQIAYPYGKYDQLIVPDFNIGAMENIAAVTFTEGYVTRGIESETTKENRASTILHEMAHMWFGNLVTQQWWNGLWLNESFATQMASIAMRKATRFTSGPHRFYLSSKRNAYSVDNRVSSHPIEMPVPSTADFYTVFDSITYSKGASVLMQLEQVVGPETYRQGVSHYLQKYSEGNTRLEDFINSISHVWGQDLMPWAQNWLYSTGYNQINASHTCKEGRLHEIILYQSLDNGSPILRQHTLQIAAYLRTLKDEIKRIDVTKATIKGATTVIPAGDHIVCPTFIYPNYQDWGYVKTVLGANALNALKGKISELETPLTRSMIWANLFDMTMAGDIALDDFIQRALAESKAEPDERVSRQIIDYLDQIITYLRLMDSNKNPILATLESAFWQKVVEAEQNSTLQHSWFNLYRHSAHSQVGLNRLRMMLDGSHRFNTPNMGQSERWQLIKHLAAMGYPGANQLIDAERLSDPSDAGQKAALMAEAALPDLALKKRFLTQLQQDESLGLAKARAIMAGIFPDNQRALAAQLVSDILTPLAGFSKNRDNYFVVSYATDLLPATCQAEALHLKQQALTQLDDYSLSAQKFLTEAAQNEERCLIAKQRSQK